MRALDWTDKVADDDRNAYDIVVGAEVVYDEEVFDDLAETCCDLLVDGGKLILSSKRRHAEAQDSFLQMLRKRGLELSQEIADDRYTRRQKVGIHSHDADHHDPIHFFLFEKKCM